MTEQTIKAKVVDIHKRLVFPAQLVLAAGKISQVTPLEPDEPTEGLPYAIPGFVDAHIHIESAMLVPSEFAKAAVVHGTVATVSDPHEIANVLGAEGVNFMLENARTVPFKFAFGAPSCVPATVFETAGATLGVAELESLLSLPSIKYLAEMMNWPGVLARDPEVMAKIALAQKFGKPVDGHAPGLKGKDAANYAAVGISTDHECFSEQEARDKLKAGMKILIREGSAARNFDALIGLVDEHSDRMMFCSDDKHPDELIQGHIDLLVRRAVALGKDVFDVLKMACCNPVAHYSLPVGQLQPGDPADFILVENLHDFRVLKTYIEGQLVAENGRSLLKTQAARAVNQFHASPKQPEHFAVPASAAPIRAIVVHDGELVTSSSMENGKTEAGQFVADPSQDLLKITVVNRYQDAPPAVAFIKNFGLKQGAIASSVAHDSHNIIAVGTSDRALCEAVNAVIGTQGGLSAFNGKSTEVLPLPVAGLMALDDAQSVADRYTRLDQMAKAMGCPLRAPFMSLSFMALLVIPSLKLSDKGLFDGEKFAFC